LGVIVGIIISIAIAIAIAIAIVPAVGCWLTKIEFDGGKWCNCNSIRDRRERELRFFQN
jgi:hypothetical protein